MLIRVLLAAIFAGVIAGVFATAVQAYRVVPLIMEAESYEAGASGEAHSHGSTEAESAHIEHSGAHDHGDAWAPADGWQRSLSTAVSNMLVGVAFSLITTAGILFTNQAISLQTGLVWGACGFAIFVLAPNFGLPPELPGMAGGDLRQRQIWWLATVVCTAAALFLFAFKRGWPWMAAGVVLMIAPHIYGAPQSASHASDVPAHLAAEFAIATIVASFLFWLFLGGLLGVMLERSLKKEDLADGRS